MKSPLRYPGGKTRAIKILSEYIPVGTESVCSPFFGGGSFELHLQECGCNVVGYDSFDLLVNFWQHLYNNQGIEIYDYLSRYEMPADKSLFYAIQKSIHTNTNELIKASWFYFLNRCSFSGSTLSGGMSANTPRFNQRSIECLIGFEMKIKVELMSFEKSIPLNSDKLIFADPPYFIDQSLYGTRGNMHDDFDHKLLSEVLLKHGNFILTYNDCEYVRSLYDGCKIDVVQWAYGMNKTKKSNEIIITKFI